MKNSFSTFLSKLRIRYLIYPLVFIVAAAVFPLLGLVAAIAIIAAETRFQSKAKKEEEEAPPDRTQQTTAEGVTKLVLLLLLGALLIFIAAHIILFVGEAVLISDNNLTTENMIRVSLRLEAYKTEHGSYPPQQDMRSLLETLGIQKSDFRKTFFFDLYSATYHAPPEDSTDPEDRFITMRVKWHLFEGYDHLLFLRRDGTVGSEYLKDKTQESERKPEPDQSIITQQELN
jgi:hypothetical protein